MKQHSFEKFINKEKNSRKKEAIKQEKRKWKEEKKKRHEERARDMNYEMQVSKFISSKKENTQPGRRPLKQASKAKAANADKPASTEMPLNKFIAYAGVCGRREAAELVKEGKVKVNGNIIYEPGFKVTAADIIVFNNKKLHLQKNLVYILLNKPKDYITTAKDTHGRKTVFELVQQATDERIYPVGRLDRNTTGVLLLTNDGELTQKLTHPSFEIKKIYEAKLDKPLLKKDMEALLKGFELEDGFIAADAVGYAGEKDKSLIGIEIHSGRNRIVRRLFEHLGYEVKGLDRVLFANLTKKNLERGKWRFLHEKEVRLLKYMNQSFVRKKSKAAPEKSG
ncbi:pseudouridine synthase [Parafilimonas sp.]|uniref:pseudouridine synthase n=1 Tax=Parafilimonas sp. TaxID=1969739 RepID=UPI0039E3E71D